MLGEHGLGYKRIAGLAGLGVTPVRTILWGRQDPGPRKGELPKRVKRETAERILAVRPSLDLLGDRTLVSARPYIRRIRALIAAGWTQRELGVRLGCGTNLCTTLASYERQSRRHRTYQITAARARAIVALYDELNLIRPTGVAADRSRAYAAARGWPDPWAWEVYDNDFDRPSPPFAKASTA
ncbi:hypothetical protein [Agromyces larvae]|uniref:XRE family transcriptional regulator n=1 Tax=Agromyces larvae TaxID=2929802 RepID=A0ABY4C5N7_9MICO|nr:hypothetical protein [Agromyces larvae]UOE45496.1 hypothetical protein MTO99_06990 [Agromyces larvae]